jgi:hypothetical protein
MKEIWFKTLDKMETLTMEYGEVMSLVREMVGGNCRLIFSIFQTAPGRKWTPESWTIIIPNIKSEKPVYEGKVKFISKWEEYDGNTIKNPTWKDILIEANNAANGDHVFLESLREQSEIDGVKVIDMTFGS